MVDWQAIFFGWLIFSAVVLFTIRYFRNLFAQEETARLSVVWMALKFLILGLGTYLSIARLKLAPEFFVLGATLSLASSCIALTQAPKLVFSIRKR